MENKNFSDDVVHVSKSMIVAVFLLAVVPAAVMTSYFVGTGLSKAMTAIERSYSA